MKEIIKIKGGAIKMAKESVLKVEGLFKGCNIAASGVASIKFRSAFAEITNYVNLVGMQDEDLILAVKDEIDGPFKKVGIMRLKSINFKGADGADFTFKGERIDLPNINSFLDKTVVFAVKYRKRKEGGE